MPTLQSTNSRANIQRSERPNIVFKVSKTRNRARESASPVRTGYTGKGAEIPTDIGELRRLKDWDDVCKERHEVMIAEVRGLYKIGAIASQIFGSDDSAFPKTVEERESYIAAVIERNVTGISAMDLSIQRSGARAMSILLSVSIANQQKRAEPKSRGWRTAQTRKRKK